MDCSRSLKQIQTRNDKPEKTITTSITGTPLVPESLGHGIPNHRLNSSKLWLNQRAKACLPGDVIQRRNAGRVWDSIPTQISDNHLTATQATASQSRAEIDRGFGGRSSLVSKAKDAIFCKALFYANSQVTFIDTLQRYPNAIPPVLQIFYNSKKRAPANNRCSLRYLNIDLSYSTAAMDSQRWSMLLGVMPATLMRPEPTM